MVCAACSALRERSSLCCCTAAGARQLFVGDAETGRTAFQLLYAFILEQVRRVGTPVWAANANVVDLLFPTHVSHSVQGMQGILLLKCQTRVIRRTAMS